MEKNITNDKIMADLNPAISENMTDQAVSDYIKAEMRAGFKANILIGRELRVFLNDGRYKSLGFDAEKKYLESLQAENLWSVATSYNWMNAAVLADVMGYDPSDLIGMPMMAVYKAGSLISAHKVADDKWDSFRAMVESLRGKRSSEGEQIVRDWEEKNGQKQAHGNSGKARKTGVNNTPAENYDGEAATQRANRDAIGDELISFGFNDATLKAIRIYVQKTDSIANKKDFAAHLTALLERELNTITVTANATESRSMVAGAVN